MTIQIETGLLRRCFATTVLAVVALAAGAAQAQGIPGRGTWETTLQPRDLNGDRVADAFYDTALNITWLRNGNMNQDMTWADAKAWASNLVVGGIGGWRLPTMVDTGPPGCDNSNAGGTDCGVNVQPDSGEMAHLYYVTLGNLGECTPGDSVCTVKQAGYGLANSGDFKNLQACCYWTDVIDVTDTRQAWMFNNRAGKQAPLQVSNKAYAIAVLAGDVAAVPEPQTHALLLLGLGTLVLACQTPPPLNAVSAQRGAPIVWRASGLCCAGGVHRVAEPVSVVRRLISLPGQAGQQLHAARCRWN